MERFNKLKSIRRSADALRSSRKQAESKIIRFPAIASVEEAEFRAADYSAPEMLEEGFIEASEEENLEN